nr:MAG TPA: hypothetical protein [Caudoviricetes sp.]
MTDIPYNRLDTAFIDYCHYERFSNSIATIN